MANTLFAFEKKLIIQHEEKQNKVLQTFPKLKTAEKDDTCFSPVKYIIISTNFYQKN